MPYPDNVTGADIDRYWLGDRPLSHLMAALDVACNARADAVRLKAAMEAFLAVADALDLPCGGPIPGYDLCDLIEPLREAAASIDPEAYFARVREQQVEEL